jgi:hypothetical protein
MLKIWFAYIQTFEYNIVHVDSNSNALADCLSRCVYVPPRPTPQTPQPLKVAKRVPAPSLLRSGDIESNPGPKSADEVITIDSDDDPIVSVSDAPVVAAITRAVMSRTRSADKTTQLNHSYSLKCEFILSSTRGIAQLLHSDSLLMTARIKVRGTNPAKGTPIH